MCVFMTFMRSSLIQGRTACFIYSATNSTTIRIHSALYSALLPCEISFGITGMYPYEGITEEAVGLRKARLRAMNIFLTQVCVPD